MAMPMRKRGGTGLTKSLLELLPPTWAEAKSLSGGIMEPFWVGESSIRVEQYIYARIYLVDGGRDMGTQPTKKLLQANGSVSHMLKPISDFDGSKSKG